VFLHSPHNIKLLFTLITFEWFDFFMRFHVVLHLPTSVKLFMKTQSKFNEVLFRFSDITFFINVFQKL
jgi:hypothetical protein